LNKELSKEEIKRIKRQTLKINLKLKKDFRNELDGSKVVN
jgi:hypothetical protein